MPSNVYWIEAPFIMSADYNGEVTVKDLDDAMEKCLAAVDKGPCCFLVDTQAMTSVTPSVMKIGSMLRLVNHPNACWFAFVGQNIMLKFAVQVLLSSHRKFKMMESREQALTFLRERVQYELSPQPVSTVTTE
jgi:hypothetical protein